MKRVIIFSTNYLPNIGGAEIAIKEITDRVSDMEFEMIVPRLDSTLPRREKMGNILVSRIGFGVPLIDKLLIPFIGAIRAWGIYNARGADVFWCMMVSWGSGAGYVHNIIHFWKKIPIVLTLQEGDSEEHIARKRGGMIGRSWRLALKRTAHVTVISTYLKEMARRYGYRGEITLVPNGVDIERFAIEGKEREEVRREMRERLDIGEKERVLITVSRLEKKNAVGDIIESLTYLPPNTKLVAIGTGSLEGSLKKRVHDLGLSERVLFRGRIENSEIPKYLAVSDVFVRPSLSEGQGISFLEAMAAGVPVVATPVGGITDFLEHEKTGLLCGIGNPKSIARQVQRLFDEEKLGDRIIHNSRTLVEDEYNWNTIAKDMRGVLIKTAA